MLQRTSLGAVHKVRHAGGGGGGEGGQTERLYEALHGDGGIRPIIT